MKFMHLDYTTKSILDSSMLQLSKLPVAISSNGGVNLSPTTKVHQILLNSLVIGHTDIELFKGFEKLLMVSRCVSFNALIPA